MEALLLAAGLGTRLKPLTNNRPKALVEVNGISLLEWNLNRLINSGSRKIVVNVHHFGDQVIDFIKGRTWSIPIEISDERDLLLDTGGAIKKSEPLFSGKEPILIHNVDILSHINLEELVNHHLDSKSFATLAVSERETSRMLLFSPEDSLCGWMNQSTRETLWTDEERKDYRKLAFSGIAVISPELLNLLPEADHPYSVIPEYLRIAKNHGIKAFTHKKEDWIDVGKPETLALASKFIELNNIYHN